MDDFVHHLLTKAPRGELEKTDENGWTPLMHAAINGSSKAAAYLLKVGAPTDVISKDGKTLLSAACSGNLVWLVRHICDGLSQEISNPREYVNIADSNGMTATHEAASCGSDRCLEILLSTKLINVDATDNYGRVPIMYAAYSGSFECLKLLYNYNANLNIVDGSKNGLLVYAVEGGNMEILQFLQKHHQFSNPVISQAKVTAIRRGAIDMAKMLSLDIPEE